jgi:hypothetical protein
MSSPVAAAVRLHEVLLDQFVASFGSPPEELVLDFDATDNPLHGQDFDDSPRLCAYACRLTHRLRSSAPWS